MGYACPLFFFFSLSSPYSLTYVPNLGYPHIAARPIIDEIIASCGLQPDQNEFHQEILEVALTFFDVARYEVGLCLDYPFTSRPLPTTGGGCFFSVKKSFFAALALSWRFLLEEVGLDEGLIEELAERIHTPASTVAEWVEGMQDLLIKDNLPAYRELSKMPSFL